MSVMQSRSMAPIGISAYARLHHLMETITALQKNQLSGESMLYIFSDGAKPGDEEKVREVREYLKTVTGFRKISVIERAANNRVYNNRSGMRQLLEEYGSLIWLEEDIVTAPAFLTYMNQALTKYRDNPQVMSITGWCPPITIPSDYGYDAFFLRRFNAWGFGLWKDRFGEILMDTRTECQKLVRDSRAVKEFSRFGEDMLRLVKLDAAGKIDALDVKAMLTQYINGKYTVYPVGSLVRNIGFDGSGMHCKKTSRFDSELAVRDGQRTLPQSVFEDQRIIEAHRGFRSDGILTRVRRRLSFAR